MARERSLTGFSGFRGLAGFRFRPVFEAEHPPDPNSEPLRSFRPLREPFRKSIGEEVSRKGPEGREVYDSDHFSSGTWVRAAIGSRPADIRHGMRPKSRNLENPLIWLLASYSAQSQMRLGFPSDGV
jgi:hypothetical protein